MKSSEESCPQFFEGDFFKNMASELKEISVHGKLEKQTQRRLKKIKRLEFSKKETCKLEQSLLNNLVLDYLRSNSLNYSYSVFMRECNFLSADVLPKSTLSQLLHVQDQLQQEEQFNISIIQLLAKVIQQNKQKKVVTTEQNVQAEIIKMDGTFNNDVLLENRLSEVRKQVQMREKKYYEKMIESVRSKEIMELREQIRKEEEEKLKKQRMRIKKREEEMKERRNSLEQESKILTENEELRNINRNLKGQIKQAKEENKKMRKELMSHNCQQTQEWKALEASVKTDRKHIEEKKKQLELAFMNINTKVEQMVREKDLIKETNTDKFQQKIRIEKQNKDHMIETIYGQLKQMSIRVQNLTADNQQLRQQNSIQQKKIKEIKEGKEQIIASNTSIQCEKCKLANKFKGDTKNMLVGVGPEDFELEEAECADDSDSEEEEEEKKEIEFKAKTNKLQSNMRLIKNQVRLMVQDFP